MSVKVIEGLYSNVSDVNEHIEIDVTDVTKLKTINNYFEITKDNKPQRIYIDLDGKLIKNENETELQFKKRFKKIDTNIINKLNTIDDISIITASSIKALKIDRKKGKIFESKLSYRLTFIKIYCNTIDDMIDYIKINVIPLLKNVLSTDLDNINILNGKDDNNYLDIDFSVYRKGDGGKMRCVNAYKIPEEVERYNKLIKGYEIDTLIGYIPNDCKLYKKEINNKYIKEDDEEDDEEEEIKYKVKKDKKETKTDEYIEDVNDELLEKILSNLKKNRFKNYNDWFKIACIFISNNYNIEIFEKYSKKYGDVAYNKESNEKIYKSISNKNYNYTISTLYFMLKEDNKNIFTELIVERSDIIQLLFSKHNNNIFAKFYYNLEPNKYIYSKSHGWYEYNEYNILKNTGNKIPISMKNSITSKLQYQIKLYENNLKSPSLDLDKEEYKKQCEKIKTIKLLCKEKYDKIGNSKFIDSIIDFLPEYYYDENIFNKLDNDETILAFNNMVYDIKINKFRNIEPTDYITLTTGYNLNVEINTEPKILNEGNRKYLNDVLNSIFDEKTKEYFLLIISLAIFFNKYQSLYIATGSGSNGKGVLFNFISKILGNYYLVTENSFLTTKFEAGKPNPTLAIARGKRFLVIPECEESGKDTALNQSFVKQITGKDEINTRGLFEKNIYPYIPKFTAFVMCNNKPEIKNMDSGMMRRPKVIPFNYKFVDKDKITETYHREINTDLSNILTKQEIINEFIMLLLEIAYKNKDLNTIKPPEDVITSTNEYLDENNPVKFWINENVIITNNIKDKIRTSLLFDCFCKTNNNLRMRDFNTSIKQNGIINKVIGGYSYFVGIKIKEEEEENKIDFSKRIL